MLSRRQGKSKSLGTETPESGSRRPYIIQRLSNMMPSMPRRDSDITNCADMVSTSSVGQTHSGRNSRWSARRVANVALTNTLTSENETYPYDDDYYQSFPEVIEKHSCWNCGLQPPWSKSSDSPLQPCEECRSGSASSHITNNACIRKARRSRSVQASSPLSSLPPAQPVLHVPKVLLEGGPKTTRLPRYAPLNTLDVPRDTSLSERPPTRHGPLPQFEQGFTFDRLLNRLPPRLVRLTPSPKKPPTPPKLHHLHGLPHSKEFPYVHKREVERHLAAQRAGQPSPITAFQELADRPRTANGKGRSSYTQDWSDTIYYGRGQTPITPRPSPVPPVDPRPSARRNQKHKLSSSPPTLSADEGHRQPKVRFNLGPPFSPSLPPSTVLRPIEDWGKTNARSDSTINHEVQQSKGKIYHVRQSSEASSCPPSPLREVQNASSLSTKRSSDSSDTDAELPKMRGGDDDLREWREPVHAASGYRIKKWLLTCPYPFQVSEEPDSRDDPLPSRPVPEDSKIVTNGRSRRVPLPNGITRPWAGKSCVREDTSAATDTDKRLLTLTPTTRSTSTHEQPYVSSKIPPLRGGGLPTLNDTDPLPLTLWMLAGGRGKPITVAGWNKTKPKNRMGGLIGMAIYGCQAGMPYTRGRKETAVVAGSPAPVPEDASVASQAQSTEAEHLEASDTSGADVNAANGGPCRDVDYPIALPQADMKASTSSANQTAGKAANPEVALEQAAPDS